MTAIKYTINALFVHALFIWSGIWLLHIEYTGWLIPVYFVVWWAIILINLIVINLSRDAEVIEKMADILLESASQGKYSPLFTTRIMPLIMIVSSAGMLYVGAVVTGWFFFAMAFLYTTVVVKKATTRAQEKYDATQPK
jgi:hypothetical protein